MKKILSVVSLSLFSLVCSAQQVVNIVWPFAPASSQAVMYRNLIDSANQMQSKYKFVFQNKPGAGGTIAVREVLGSNDLTVLATSNSFYSRPLMYRESYDIEHLNMINTICLHGPISLLSKKYKSFDEVKNQEFNVGVIPGSVTQLLAELLQINNPGLKITVVPYKDTPSATKDMIGGHLDASADLFSVGTLATLTTDVNIMGITGNRNIETYKTFHSSNIKGVDQLTNNYYLFVPKTVDKSTQKELNQIFNDAIGSKVKQSCLNEHGTVETMDLNQISMFEKTMKIIWVNFTKHVQKQ